MKITHKNDFYCINVIVVIVSVIFSQHILLYFYSL